MEVALMWLFLFILWIILNGRITLELVIFGILIATAVTLFTNRVIGYRRSTDVSILRNLPLVIMYLIYLIWQIILSALTLAGMVFRAEDPDPVIVEFHSGLVNESSNVLLANSITLTPGTITVFQDGDHFVVHCLRREYAEGIKDSSFVRLLRRVK